MCQTEDHFDCQPAVLAALDFAKTANNGGIEDAEMAKKIDFEEFGAFLQAVKLYYSFCEVNISRLCVIFPPTNLVFQVVRKLFCKRSTFSAPC